LWRAGCVDEAHVRFGKRAGETHRWKHRQGAPVRLHHVNVRLEETKLCLLVLIGVRADGRKELIALDEGYREASESWADLLRDAKRRGMRAPVLAIGDGALGFWGALREVFPETKEQRCWFHKIANVLGALPKSAHPGAKKALAQIWNAEDKCLPVCPTPRTADGPPVTLYWHPHPLGNPDVVLVANLTHAEQRIQCDALTMPYTNPYSLQTRIYTRTYT
jgi:hypothetical protein